MNRRTALTIALLLAGTFLAGGCATPYDIGSADPRVTPSEAARDVSGMLNHNVAWGGQIATAKNLKDRTELEVVGYPLDAVNRPDRDAKPTGRFIVIRSGYLETADYAPGRLITVVGMVTQTRAGTVGEAKYIYPVVMADRLRLWPRPDAAQGEPRFHFGVGVGIIR
ncbi:MAG: Slp family lipoprotein [Sulfuricaulis sp.]